MVVPSFIFVMRCRDQADFPIRVRGSSCPGGLCRTVSSPRTWFFIGTDLAGVLHQAGHVGPANLAGIATHDAFHGGVGFQRRGIDTHFLPVEQSFLTGQLENPNEYGIVDFKAMASSMNQSIMTRIGGLFCGAIPRTSQRQESLHRHATPRCEPIPSKYPASSIRKVHAGIESQDARVWHSMTRTVPRFTHRTSLPPEARSVSRRTHGPAMPPGEIGWVATQNSPCRAPFRRPNAMISPDCWLASQRGRHHKAPTPQKG